MSVAAEFTPAVESLGPDRLRRLLRASHELNSSLELEPLLPRILQEALAAVNAAAGSIWLVEGEKLRCASAAGEGAELVRGRELPLSGGTLAEVARRDRPLRAPAADTDGQPLREVAELTGTSVQGLLAVPLEVGGEVLGVLCAVNARASAGFQEVDLQFLEALADDAAAAVRNARLFEAERRAHDLKALLDFSREVGASLDRERVAVSVVNLAAGVVRFDRCVLALWHDEKLHVRAISGQTHVERKHDHLPELDHLLSWAAERKAPLEVEDVSAPDEVAARLRASFPGYLAAARVRALLLLPIRDGQGEIGWLLFEFTQPTRLDRRTREAAELLVGQAALALRNADLYAEVPLVHFLEPIREGKRALVDLPGPVWLAYLGIAVVLLLLATVIRLPLRIGAHGATVRDAVQQPVRAGVAGLVEQVLVREGERVPAGTPVARLRNEELLARLREADAGLALAQREAAAAQAGGDAGGAVLARVRAAQWLDTRALLSSELGRTTVVTPVPGVVLTPRVEERAGDWVQAGEPLVQVGDPDRAELELAIAQQDIGEVALGDRVRARVDALPSVTFEGRVTAIAPRADSSGERLFTVRAVLDNREHLLRPGMALAARILARSRPIAALALRPPLRWVRMHLWW